MKCASKLFHPTVVPGHTSGRLPRPRACSRRPSAGRRTAARARSSRSGPSPSRARRRAPARRLQFFTPICCHRHLAPMATALRATGSTSSVLRKTSTMSTCEGRPRAGRSSSRPGFGVARVHRHHAVTVTCMYLATKLLGRCHSAESPTTATVWLPQDAAQGRDVVGHGCASQSGPELWVRAHDRSAPPPSPPPHYSPPPPPRCYTRAVRESFRGGRRRRSRKAERSGKRTDRAPGVSSLERGAPPGRSTEGATAGRCRSANLSGKADSEGPPTVGGGASALGSYHVRRRAAADPAARPACDWAPAWCPSPATRCRCSIPPASWPSTTSAAQSAALFDVSHMGQLRLIGADAAKALETLMPVDVIELGVPSSATASSPMRKAACSTT